MNPTAKCDMSTVVHRGRGMGGNRLEWGKENGKKERGKRPKQKAEERDAQIVTEIKWRGFFTIAHAVRFRQLSPAAQKVHA